MNENDIVALSDTTDEWGNRDPRSIAETVKVAEEYGLKMTVIGTNFTLTGPFVAMGRFYDSLIGDWEWALENLEIKPITDKKAAFTTYYAARLPEWSNVELVDFMLEMATASPKKVLDKQAQLELLRNEALRRMNMATA